MKKKIITLVVWLALTVLYVWNLGDSGRYIGFTTTWALEDYSQMMVEPLLMHIICDLQWVTWQIIKCFVIWRANIKRI